MTLRSGHGNGKNHLVRVEVLPPDEQPVGERAPTRPEVKGDHGDRGKLVPGEETRALASIGGLASAKVRAERKRLERLLGRAEVPDGHALAPYRKDAADWRDAHLARLGQAVGGGEVGPATQEIVSSAAMQHMLSRWFFDQFILGMDPTFASMASKYANDSRQNLLAAHELCAREAASRPKGPIDPFA